MSCEVSVKNPSKDPHVLCVNAEEFTLKPGTTLVKALHPYTTFRTVREAVAAQLSIHGCEAIEPKAKAAPKGKAIRGAGSEAGYQGAFPGVIGAHAGLPSLGSHANLMRDPVTDDAIRPEPPIVGSSNILVEEPGPFNAVGRNVIVNVGGRDRYLDPTVEPVPAPKALAKGKSKAAPVVKDHSGADSAAASAATAGPNAAGAEEPDTRAGRSKARKAAKKAEAAAKKEEKKAAADARKAAKKEEAAQKAADRAAKRKK